MCVVRETELLWYNQNRNVTYDLKLSKFQIEHIFWYYSLLLLYFSLFLNMT